MKGAASTTFRPRTLPKEAISPVPAPCLALLALLLAADGGATSPPATEARHATIAPHTFKVLEQDSGPVNYYSVVTEGDVVMIHSAYKPGLATVVLAGVVPEEARKRVSRMSWRWRVHSLPKDSNDCGPGFTDSGAAVFLTFKAGAKYMILKYVWSTTGKVGSYCQSKRGWFLDRDTILLHVGGPLDTWVTEEVDPRADFAKHFGVKPEDIPDFVGIAIMTDGDQSNSVVESDYTDFTIHW
jgi:Protein of unknown function (DUF3047)